MKNTISLSMEVFPMEYSDVLFSKWPFEIEYPSHT